MYTKDITNIKTLRNTKEIKILQHRIIQDSNQRADTNYRYPLAHRTKRLKKTRLGVGVGGGVGTGISVTVDV